MTSREHEHTLNVWLADLLRQRGYVDATRTCHRGRYAGIEIRGGRRLGRDSGI